MKIKRFAAALCALAVVAASTGGLPIDKVGLFDTTITANAETIGTWTSGSCTLTLDDAGTLTMMLLGRASRRSVSEYDRRRCGGE